MTGIHPAVFSANLIEPMAEMVGVREGGYLLDPCAGLGWKLAEIAGRCRMVPIGFEIEKGYAEAAAPWVHLGVDSCALPMGEMTACAAVTSFVYPNGMADNFHAKDDSTRHTYVHRLRAKLGPEYELANNNMAKTNPRRSNKAMARFYEIQRRIIGEVFRVLEPGAPFVVNTKDTPYSAYTWATRDQLLDAGFHIESVAKIAAHGLNHGKGHEGKAEFEELTLARRPA